MSKLSTRFRYSERRIRYKHKYPIGREYCDLIILSASQWQEFVQ